MSNDKKKKNGGIRSVILSIVLAIILWIVIGVIQDPDVSGTITNIPIEFEGESYLTENGLIVSSASDTVNAPITISGKRRDLIESSQSVSVNVDVAEITEAGDYTLTGIVTTSTNRISVNTGRITVPVKVEKLVTKEFSISVNQMNVPKGTLIKTTLSENKVKASGAESEIENLECVTADIDASKVTEGSSEELTLKPKSKSMPAAAKNTSVTLAFNKVTATNHVYEKKTLPVKLKLNQKLAYDYWLDTDASVCAVSSVDVGVTAESTAECVYLNINTADSEDGKFMLLEEENMYIPEESAEIYAEPALVKKEQRHMDIAVTAENVPAGLNAVYNNTLTGILVSAPAEVLNAGNITATIDLTGMTAGTHTVTVKMKDERVTFAEEITAEVILE